MTQGQDRKFFLGNKTKNGWTATHDDKKGRWPKSCLLAPVSFEWFAASAAKKKKITAGTTKAPTARVQPLERGVDRPRREERRVEP